VCVDNYEKSRFERMKGATKLHVNNTIVTHCVTILIHIASEPMSYGVEVSEIVLQFVNIIAINIEAAAITTKKLGTTD